MKRMFLSAMLCMAMCVGFTSCGGDDDSIIPDEKEEVYVPQETLFSKTYKQYPVWIMMYNPSTSTMWGYFRIMSNNMDQKTLARLPYFSLSFVLKGDDGANKWNGTYEIRRIEGQLYDNKGNATSSIYAYEPYDTIKGAWVKFIRTGNVDSYGRYEYHMTFHADKIVEENGDWTNGLDFDYTGYAETDMLTY